MITAVTHLNVQNQAKTLYLQIDNVIPVGIRSYCKREGHRPCLLLVFWLAVQCQLYIYIYFV